MNTHTLRSHWIQHESHSTYIIVTPYSSIHPPTHISFSPLSQVFTSIAFCQALPLGKREKSSRKDRSSSFISKGKRETETWSKKKTLRHDDSPFSLKKKVFITNTATHTFITQKTPLSSSLGKPLPAQRNGKGEYGRDGIHVNKKKQGRTTGTPTAPPPNRINVKSLSFLSPVLKP